MTRFEVLGGADCLRPPRGRARDAGSATSVGRSASTKPRSASGRRSRPLGGERAPAAFGSVTRIRSTQALRRGPHAGQLHLGRDQWIHEPFQIANRPGVTLAGFSRAAWYKRSTAKDQTALRPVSKRNQRQLCRDRMTYRRSATTRNRPAVRITLTRQNGVRRLETCRSEDSS